VVLHRVHVRRRAHHLGRALPRFQRQRGRGNRVPRVLLPAQRPCGPSVGVRFSRPRRPGYNCAVQLERTVRCSGNRPTRVALRVHRAFVHLGGASEQRPAGLRKSFRCRQSWSRARRRDDPCRQGSSRVERIFRDYRIFRAQCIARPVGGTINGPSVTLGWGRWFWEARYCRKAVLATPMPSPWTHRKSA